MSRLYQRLWTATRQLVLSVLLVAAWQTASWLELLNEHLLPSPFTVIAAWFHLFTEQRLLGDIGTSMLRVFSGFAIGAVVGSGLGLALNVVPRFSGQVRIIVEVLRPIPPIAWIPLAVLWFGLGGASAVFIVALGAFFPIFINAYDGVAGVDIAYVHTAKSLGATKRQLLTEILLPAALPQMFIGLRVGLGIAWISVIAAELVGAQSGLGYMIQLNRILLQTENVIAGMFTIGIIGFLMTKALELLEQSVVPWNQQTVSRQAREGR